MEITCEDEQKGQWNRNIKAGTRQEAARKKKGKKRTHGSRFITTILEEVKPVPSDQIVGMNHALNRPTIKSIKE